MNAELSEDVYTRRSRPGVHALGAERRGETQNILDIGALLKPMVRDLGKAAEKNTGLQMYQADDVREARLSSDSLSKRIPIYTV